MAKKSFQSPIPSAYKGLQVNFCRTPSCEYYGLNGEEALQYKQEKDNYPNKPLKRSDIYMITGVGKDESSIKCKACLAEKEHDPFRRNVFNQIKSNKAAFEEYERVSRYLERPDTRCPVLDCPSHVQNLPSKIKKAGTTKAGTQRYRCGHCRKSWSEDRAEKDFNRPEINKQFFKQLVSKTPFKRIVEIYDLTMPALYRRIDYIHRQCMRFVAERERRMSEKIYDRMYLCTDSQVQISNWTDRKVKKNAEFYRIGTADLRSGYILAFNINYDGDVDPNDIEQQAFFLGDSRKKRHERYFARLWLQHEFEQNKIHASMIDQIPDWDELTVEERQDAISALKSSSETYDDDNQLPHKGMAVHNEYSIIAHFLLIKRLTANVEKTRFYLDRDTGLKTWYLAAFKDLIKARRSDAFHIAFDKGLTIDERKRIYGRCKKDIESFSGASFKSMTNPSLKNVIAQMMKPNVVAAQYPQSLDDVWVKNPTPSMAEPNKRVSAITDITELDIDHQAHLHRIGGLHAIDRFFPQIRRKVAMFERPISPSSNAHRVWYIYSPYNPRIYQVLGDIFRVYYNFCQKSDKDGETPAMRLGLAKGIVSLEQIIYYGRYKPE